MELNKTIQDLKIKVETIKNKSTQRERALEIETLGKKSGTIDVSINNRIQDRQNLRCRRFHRKHDTTIKEIKKCKKMLILKIKEIQDTHKHIFRSGLHILHKLQILLQNLQGPSDFNAKKSYKWFNSV